MKRQRPNKHELSAIPEDVNLGYQHPDCKKKKDNQYPEGLKKYWKLQDIEKSLELIFRDYSYHLKMGMGQKKVLEFYDVIMHEIRSVFKNEEI